MLGFVRSVDKLSLWIGHAFAWCIVVLTVGITYEVFVRYVLNDPTIWAFDISYMMYGALFFMAGPYTLSRAGHVRVDILSRLWPPRTQARVELVLYLLFFFPGVLALLYAGISHAEQSVRYREVSIFSPAGIPIYPLKILLPLGSALLVLQGCAEVCRCLVCVREGRWPPRLHDVEELDLVIMEKLEAGEAVMVGAGGTGVSAGEEPRR